MGKTLKGLIIVVSVVMLIDFVSPANYGSHSLLVWHIASIKSSGKPSTISRNKSGFLKNYMRRINASSSTTTKG